MENDSIGGGQPDTHEQARWDPYIWRDNGYGQYKNSSDVSRVTPDHWVVSCLGANTAVGDPGHPDSDGAGEGYIATATDGTKYTFARLDYLDADDYAPVVDGSGFTSSRLLRKMATMFATKVEDVHGNWVEYTYSTDGKLTRIHSNDGREITLTYLSGTKYISSVTANGRTWTYTYQNYQEKGSPPLQTVKILHRVTQPDGKYWEYSIGDLTRTKPGTGNSDPTPKTITIKHPYGTLASYQITDLKYDSVRLPPYTPGSGRYWRKIKSVTSKTLSGASIPTSTWTYMYRFPEPTRNNTTVVDPAGRATIYRHVYMNNVNGKGKARVLASVEKYDSLNGTLMETITNTYAITEPFGLVGVFENSTDMPTIKANLTKRVVTRDGDTYTTEHTYNTSENSSSYSYGRPTSIKTYSNVSTLPRETIVDYVHRKDYWVLGLRDTVTTNGRNIAQYGYDTVGRKIWEDRYGSRYASYTYYIHATTSEEFLGAVKSIRDAENRSHSLSEYKRGIPQETNGPVFARGEVVVDDNGWITARKDYNGYWTTYQRDNMGRVTKIIPSKTQKAWLDTDITYVFGSDVTQTITRGNKQEILTYDTLFRPVLEEMRDTASGNSIYTTSTYNPAGELTFRSFPSHGTNPTAGLNTGYDGLGRIKTTAETVSPYATVTHNYLSGHRHQIVDATGQPTTNYYDGYSGPGKGKIIRIAQPMNVNTYLYRNVWGQMTELRQAGTHNGFSMDVSQYFYYDGQQRLCRHRTLEGGDTLYAYDKTGDMSAYAHGMPAGTSCTPPSGSSAVYLTRDNRGRVTFKNFASTGTTDIRYTYDRNNNLTFMRRGSNNNWSYTYDELNNLTSEQLKIDGRTYTLTYTYDTSENLIQRVLPSGRAVDYTYDGLGRQTSVTSGGTAYASNIDYHADNSVSELTYGNGHVYTRTLNARLLPQRLWARKGAATALDSNYSYDTRGDVLSLVDGTNSSNTRSYGYDALGRLVSASGPWGTGSFKYDPVGNLREKKLGSRTVTVSYDGLNRATSSNDTQGGFRQINHDNRGNVTLLGGLSFTYGFDDQPSAVSGTTTGTYVYDSNMKRVKSTLPGKTIYNVFDKSGSLVHVDVDQTVPKVTDYIKGAGMTLARVTNNSPTYLHTDHLGSPVAGTNSAGTVLWIEQYTPYGEKRIDSSVNADLGSFTGHIDDDVTGLTYMQARYFDPITGRFLSRDPVQFVVTRPDSFNRYSYAANDPINAVDPDGEFWHIVGAGVLGGVVGAAVNAAVQYKMDGEVNLRDVAAAGLAAGGASAAIAANPALAASPAAVAAISGVSNVAGSVGSDVANGRDVDVTKAAVAGVAGAVAGPAGAKAGDALEAVVRGAGPAANSVAGEVVGAAFAEGLAAGGTVGVDAAADAVDEAVDTVKETAREIDEALDDLINPDEFPGEGV